MLSVATPTKESERQLLLMEYRPAVRQHQTYHLDFKVGNRTRAYEIQFKDGRLFSVASHKRNDFSSLSVRDFLTDFFHQPSRSLL